MQPTSLLFRSPSVGMLCLAGIGNCDTFLSMAMTKRCETPQTGMSQGSEGTEGTMNKYWKVLEINGMKQRRRALDTNTS